MSPRTSTTRIPSAIYPFGMVMPGREYAAEEYKFGFNGEEKLNEIGFAYSYEFRVNETRLGRFLSVDPLFRLFSFYTPYQFCSNSPILAKELEGLESSEIANETEKQNNQTASSSSSISYVSSEPASLSTSCASPTSNSDCLYSSIELYDLVLNSFTTNFYPKLMENLKWDGEFGIVSGSNCSEIQSSIEDIILKTSSGYKHLNEPGCCQTLIKRGINIAVFADGSASTDPPESVLDYFVGFEMSKDANVFFTTEPNPLGTNTTVFLIPPKASEISTSYEGVPWERNTIVEDSDLPKDNPDEPRKTTPELSNTLGPTPHLKVYGTNFNVYRVKLIIHFQLDECSQ